MRTANYGVPSSVSQIVLLDGMLLQLRHPIEAKPGAHVRFVAFTTHSREISGLNIENDS